MITVLLVDDHISVLKNLRYLLEATEDIQVLGMASNGVEAVTEACKCRADVAVVDIAMPLMDGIEATRQIRELCPHTHVMLLSILDHPEYVQRAIEAGATGFVLKDAIGTDLLAAIRTVSMGKRYFSHKVAKIAKMYIERTSSDTWAS